MEDDHDHDGIPDLIPASMLAAYAFCPRLCYLQFVQGEFADSAELAEGRLLHRAQRHDLRQGPPGVPRAKAEPILRTCMKTPTVLWHTRSAVSSRSNRPPGLMGPMSLI